MEMEIENSTTRHVQGVQEIDAPRYIYSGEDVAGEPVDSYEEVPSAGPHWMSRLPLVGRALPFLSLTACGLGSSFSTEVKVGAGVALVAGFATLFHLLNRSINNRRIAALPSPLQMMKYGVPRMSFPRKLKPSKAQAVNITTYYVRNGFTEEAARRVAYAWHFHDSAYSEGIGDLNQLDLQRGDLFRILPSFPRAEGYPFDTDLPDAMERVGCSGAVGSMFYALDRGIRTAPECVNISLALNLKAYHTNVRNPVAVASCVRYILSKFSSRSAAKYEVSGDDVKRLLESSSSKYRSDKKIVSGITHLLFGGMALDAFEAGQFDRGLKLAFAHMRSARNYFVNSSALTSEILGRRDSINTITEKYFATLSSRALGLWKASSPGMQHPKIPWSMSMLSATTNMLQSFAVKPV